jgi:hypothetical protein
MERYSRGWNGNEVSRVHEVTLLDDVVHRQQKDRKLSRGSMVYLSNLTESGRVSSQVACPEGVGIRQPGLFLASPMPPFAGRGRKAEEHLEQILVAA